MKINIKNKAMINTYYDYNKINIEIIKTIEIKFPPLKPSSIDK